VWTGGAAQFIAGYPGGRHAFVARARELEGKFGARFTPPASLLTGDPVLAGA
jgi:3-hydroxyacyl-CoA dehydrogenase/enoyl-CoA hydratase/3-hydroxybutyryl-CoA epimerase